MAAFDRYRDGLLQSGHTTWAAAIGAASDGDEIRIAPGFRFDRLILQGRNRITVRSQVKHSRPRISGAFQPFVVPNTLWVDQGGGVWSASFAPHGLRSVVFLGTKRLFSWETLAQLQAATFPSAFIDAPGDVITLFLPDGENPNNGSVFAAARTGAIDRVLEIDGCSDIRVEGLEIRDGGAASVSVKDSTRVTLEGLVARNGVVGIRAQGQTVDLRIRHCSVQGYQDPDWAFKQSKGNVHQETTGLELETYGGSRVEFCEIEHWFNGINGSVAGDQSVDNNRDLVVCHNRIRDIYDDALEFEGYNAAVRIHDNLVEDAYSGIAMAPRFCQTEDDRMFIYRNRIFATKTIRRQPGDEDEPKLMKIGSGQDALRGGADLGAERCTLHSNDLFSTHVGIRATFGTGTKPPVGFEMRNNRVTCVYGPLLWRTGAEVDGSIYQGNEYELLSSGDKFVEIQSTKRHDYNGRRREREEIPPGIPDSAPNRLEFPDRSPGAFVSRNHALIRELRERAPDLGNRSIQNLDPEILTVSPEDGPDNGGTRVFLVGRNFEVETRVFFGSAPASQVAVLGPNALVVTAPASVAGAVDVRVETESGKASLAAGFTYE